MLQSHHGLHPACICDWHGAALAKLLNQLQIHPKPLALNIHTMHQKLIAPVCQVNQVLFIDLHRCAMLTLPMQKGVRTLHNSTYISQTIHTYKRV